jgi:predicted dehydrogenase
LDDALGNDIRAVCIVTPASTHYKLVKQALLAGKHVLVEKPLTICPNEADELVRIANEKQLRLMTGFTFLFVPSVTRSRQIIQDKPYYITSRRTNMGPIRNDVSVVWDLVPHDIALFVYLTQSPIVTVSAVGSTFLSSRTDAVNITLQFANGTIGSIFASWAEPRKVREFVIVTPTCTLVLDDVDVKAPLTIYHKGVNVNDIQTPTQEFGSFKLITKSGSLEVPDLPNAEPLKSELLHFFDCVSNPIIQCVSDGELGAMVTKTLYAIEQSILQQGQPVHLQEMYTRHL